MSSAHANPFTFRYVTGPETIALSAAISAVSILAVALRLFTRRLQKLQIGLDDQLIVGGLVFLIGMSVCLIDGAAKKILGYPTPGPPADLTNEEDPLLYSSPSAVVMGKLYFAFQLFNLLCYAFVKISIIAFYRRIFVTNKGTVFDIMTKISIAVVFLWIVAFILMTIFDCGIHVDANWGNGAQQLAFCQGIGATSGDGLAASDLILDLVLILLPIPSIWRLHMSNIRKLAVTGIMVLGVCSIAANIARLVLFIQIFQADFSQADVSLTPVDTDQVATLVMYWSVLESGLALIAACLPTLSFLLKATTIQSAVKSGRSVLSLHSWHSSKKLSECGGDRTSPAGLEHNSSDAGLAKIEVLSEQWSMQSLDTAMRSLDPAK